MFSPRGRGQGRDRIDGRVPVGRLGLLRAVIVLIVGLAVQASAVLTEVGRSMDASQPTAQSVVVAYQTRIQPILVAKCAACHTATTDRPLHYYIPVVSLWTKPFIDDHIRRGRVQFDFTQGFPAGRVGAAHEFIARLRNSVVANDMPPVEYTLVHWTHRLSEVEKKTILDWAESGITLLNAVRSLHELESVDSPDAPEEIAVAIARACPLADPKDTKARYACGEGLAQSEI